MNNQKNLEKEAMVEPLDFDATLQIIQDIVAKKNTDLKVFIPALLAVVISVISYLFVQSYPSNTLMGVCYVSVFLLLAFICLLIAYFPKATYSIKPLKETKKKKAPIFEPWQINSYMELTDEAFVTAFEEYVRHKCSEIEHMRLLSVKQEINEINHKYASLRIAFSIILTGAVLLIALLLLGTLFVDLESL